jgi:TolA-binding protein
LLSESYINLGQTEFALKALDLLVTQFPETELSGYGLVRLGKIFNQESRPEEAGEVFRAVIDYYPKSNAALLASKNLKELPL